MLGHSRVSGVLTSLDVLSFNPGKQASAYADEDILTLQHELCIDGRHRYFGFTSQSDSHLQVRTALHPCRPGSRSHFPFVMRALVDDVGSDNFSQRLTIDSNRPRHLRDYL